MGLTAARLTTTDQAQPADTARGDRLVGIQGGSAGRWPVNPDAVPDWRLRAEQRAATIGIAIPGYRTRRDFEAAVAACERTIRQQRKARPLDAAKKFAAYLEAGEYDNAQLADAYAAFCEAMEIEAPESFVRGRLKKLPGIRREIRSVRRDGRLVREAIWTVERK